MTDILMCFNSHSVYNFLGSWYRTSKGRTAKKWVCKLIIFINWLGYNLCFWMYLLIPINCLC